MGKHTASIYLIFGAAASILLALVSMWLEYTNIDTWWMNPLIWLAGILLMAGLIANEREMREMQEEADRSRAEMLRALEQSLKETRKK